MSGICDLIRETSLKVVENSKNVAINKENLKKLSLIITDEKEFENIEWRKFPGHYYNSDHEEGTVNYIFVLDCLNFCFWPSDSGWEYENIAGSIRNIIEKDRNGLNPENLLKITFDEFKKSFFSDMDFPLIKERYRLVRELASNCIKYFEGKFINIILAAKNSAEELVELITSHFRGFQDHAIYNGEQVFFYKRAQILVGDIFSAFNGESYGKFDDIDKITMFADYRVPQTLVEYGVIEYSKDLKFKIENKVILEHGGIEEVEIRAATVISVEEIKSELKNLGIKRNSIQIDHILWQKGEALKEKIYPYHRTLSIFY